MEERDKIQEASASHTPRENPAPMTFPPRGAAIFAALAIGSALVTCSAAENSEVLPSESVAVAVIHSPLALPPETITSCVLIELRRHSTGLSVKCGT